MDDGCDTNEPQSASSFAWIEINCVEKVIKDDRLLITLLRNALLIMRFNSVNVEK